MIIFNGRVHFGVGIITYLYLAMGNSNLDHVLNPVFLVVGALFPDADHRKAPIGRFVPLWLFCKHRGFTHSIQGLLLFTFMFGLFDLYWGISFAIGYISHLVLDSITPSGIRWVWKRKRPLRRGV